jgi:site-specific DNA-methyltransferase (adenine-specific)
MLPDVIDYSKISSVRLSHPTEKPVGLLQIFIKNSSDTGDIVLDGFIGTGATAIACINTGRQYIGFELEENYCKIAEDRIKRWIK